MRIRADIRLVAGTSMALRPRTWLRFHAGTSEVGCRVVARAPGESGPFAARVLLDAPVALRAGDRFVLRTSAPLNTVGGGVVIDPYAPHRSRPWPSGLTADERLERLVIESGAEGLGTAALPVRIGLSPVACMALVASAALVDRAESRLVSRAVLRDLSSDVARRVEQFHANHPLEPGMPAQLVRAGLRGSKEVIDAAIDAVTGSGVLVAVAATLSTPGWVPTPSAEQARGLEMVLAMLAAAGTEPPTVDELSAVVALDVEPLLRFLERGGNVIQVEQNRYYASDHLKCLIEKVRLAMEGRGAMSPSELRDALGLSRKYLIPLLEYCDRIGYTSRQGDGRVWRGT